MLYALFLISGTVFLGLAIRRKSWVAAILVVLLFFGPVIGAILGVYLNIH